MTNAIHLYYGDGKGKTTAALGLAVRAAGWGKKVVVVQFLKYWKTGELSSLEKLPNVTVISSKCAGGKFFNEMSEEEKTEAKARHDEDLVKAIRLYKSGECELLVLDEAVEAYQLGLLDAEMFESLLHDTPEALELVLTGHKPVKSIIEQADYVTEMKKHKHPYDKGVVARKGIEF
jgi:cob(I)alamin adenosyltransferase